MVSLPPEPQQGATSALPAAVDWVAQLLMGRLGTTLAILAVAWVGMALLQGRLAMRDGLRVVLGCFILFGAPLIARGLLDMVRGEHATGAQQVYVRTPPVAVPSKPPQFDPYAGASVPR